MTSGWLVLSGEAGSLRWLILVGLAPLPLFASGLSVGSLTCLAAGLAGAVLVTVWMGSLDGALYLVAAALPTAILVRQALRRGEGGSGGEAGWYRGGYLLLWLAGLGLLGVIGLIAYFAVFATGLVDVIATQFQLAPPAAAMAARIAPGMAVAAWMAVIAANGAAAEWLMSATGLAIRPPVDMRRLSLPLWIGPILMVAGVAGAMLRHGTVGIVCLNSAIVLIVPFAVLGLAIIHAQADNLPGGMIWVIAAYVVLLGSPALLGWRAALVFGLTLAALGSVDQLLDLRDIRGLRSGMRRK